MNTPLQREYRAEMIATGITVEEFESARGLPQWTVYPRAMARCALMYETPVERFSRRGTNTGPLHKPLHELAYKHKRTCERRISSHMECAC